jgi:hypothetical protein
MKKKLVFSTFIAAILLMGFFNAQLVSAASATPISSEYSVALTYFSPYNDEYKLDDVLIEEGRADLMFLKLEKDDTKLDLANSVFESNFPTIVGANEYSLTLTNTTYNAGVTDGKTVNTEATSNSAETLVTFKATSNATAVGQYAYARSMMAWDSNDDGDYTDAGDKGYLPHDENVKILANFQMDCEGTDDDTYASVKFVFETTTATDYTVHVKGVEGAGDTGWDLTTANGATFAFYDADDTSMVITIPLANVLDEDSESVSIIGLDYIEIYTYVDQASEYVQAELRNAAIFTNYPALTDSSDDDDDFDFRNAAGIAENMHDDMDRLFTAITEGGTEAYDNDMELNSDIENEINLFSDARYLYFTGVASMEPTQASYGSSDTSTSGMFQTDESLIFDTRDIDDLEALANILSVSNWQFNCTMDDTILYDTTDYENNLISFVVDDLEKKNTYKSEWEAASDDEEVQYDIADPSTTTGAYTEIQLSYFTKIDYGAGAVITPSGEVSQADNTTLIIVVSVVGIAIASIWYFRFRGK